MSILEPLTSKPKERKIAIALALVSTILPWPVAGLHKFYLGQPLWGGIYFLLWHTPVPRIACAIDAVWYLVQGDAEFQHQFNHLIPINPLTGQTPTVKNIAESLRELDQLRTEGLVSEYEFEQKRRQLIDRMV
ncbi:MAG: hypothetical protein ACRC6M_20250 [Microcystaceae cyanobacterium]